MLEHSSHIRLYILHRMIRVVKPFQISDFDGNRVLQPNHMIFSRRRGFRRLYVQSSSIACPEFVYVQVLTVCYFLNSAFVRARTTNCPVCVFHCRRSHFELPPLASLYVQVSPLICPTTTPTHTLHLPLPNPFGRR